MTYTLNYPDAVISIKETSAGKRMINVKPKRDGQFIPTTSCETAYPIELIEMILSAKSYTYLCDEILRDESPDYVEAHMRNDVLGYIPKERFDGTRALDFGCGSAASTMVLSRILPKTQVVGVELDAQLLRIAELRARHYKVSDRVEFFLSPDGSSLPEGIGDFDFVFLNAVYEHLLPDERQDILPLLWNHLKQNGILFVNQTPYRWFPVETHTTSGLPLINYLPDSVALWCTQRFSVRSLADENWSTLLRKGIRGGSVREMFRILRDMPNAPTLLTPNQNGLSDRIDLWYAVSSKSRYPILKRAFFYLFKLIKVSTGQVFLPSLSLAIQKT